METFNTNALAQRIASGLKTKGITLSSTDIVLVSNLISQPFKSDEQFEITCSWGEVFPVARSSNHLEMSASWGYSNSRHSNCPQNLDEAIKKASIKRNKNDEYNDNWNKQDEIITEITTIKRVVAIVRSEDKKDAVNGEVGIYE